MSKIPASVLAFEKKLVPSDGLMYGTTWGNRGSQTAPLKLQEKSALSLLAWNTKPWKNNMI